MVAAAQEAGLLQRAQLELFERVLNLGDRPISDIMTPRVDVDSIDINDDREEILGKVDTASFCSARVALTSR